MLETVEQLQMVEAMAQSVGKCMGKIEQLTQGNLKELEDAIKVRGLKISGFEQNSLNDVY